MKQILHSGTVEYEILVWDERREDEFGPLDRFIDLPAALGFLYPLLHDHTNMVALRSALTGDAFYPRMSLLTDQDVVLEVAWRLVTGALRVIALPLPSTIHGDPSENDDEEEPEEPAVVDEERHWVDFKVIDDETGDPIEDVTLKIKLPGGVARDFRTKEDGMIEIKDLDSGTCEILQMRDSEGFEVVAVE